MECGHDHRPTHDVREHRSRKIVLRIKKISANAEGKKNGNTIPEEK